MLQQIQSVPSLFVSDPLGAQVWEEDHLSLFSIQIHPFCEITQIPIGLIRQGETMPPDKVGMRAGTIMMYNHFQNHPGESLLKHSMQDHFQKWKHTDRPALPTNMVSQSILHQMPVGFHSSFCSCSQTKAVHLELWKSTCFDCTLKEISLTAPINILKFNSVE